MILSNLPNLTEDEARDFLYRFYAAYPGLKGWQQMVSDGAKKIQIDGETYQNFKVRTGAHQVWLILNRETL